MIASIAPYVYLPFAVLAYLLGAVWIGQQLRRAAPRCHLRDTLRDTPKRHTAPPTPRAGIASNRRMEPNEPS